jgi:hypothetical protein
MTVILYIVTNPKSRHGKPLRIDFVKIKVGGFDDEQLGFVVVFHPSPLSTPRIKSAALLAAPLSS